MDKLIVDCSTGDTQTVPLTDEEVAQIEANRVAADEAAAAEAARVDPDEALRQRIEAATNFAELRAALLGTGSDAAVAGRPKAG